MLKQHGENVCNVKHAENAAFIHLFWIHLQYSFNDFMS